MRASHLGLAWLAVFCAAAASAWAVPDPAPRNLTISVVGGEVRLSWLLPDPGSGNTQVKLLRRLNDPPSGPDDPAASVLATGTASQYVDPITNLLPNVGTLRVYHYAVFGCDPAGTSCEATGSRSSLAPSLVQCLRGGGYTIYWRHADADVCADRTDLGTAANTTVPNWWRSCDSNCATATARQLNAAGVQRAIFIGEQIRSLRIPIGRMISSEFCRCFRTAELMNFGPPIEQVQDITFFVYDEPNRCTHCYERIDEAPAAGGNTAIIGHAGFSTACAIISVLQWSECAIFKPDGLGGATFVTQMPWNAWGTLATDVTPDDVAGSVTMLEAPRETAEGVRIRYRIASPAVEPIRLEVFDVRGRRLWCVRPQPQGRGKYEALWDRRDERGSEVARGVYLVRLNAGRLVLNRKALVLHR